MKRFFGIVWLVLLVAVLLACTKGPAATTPVATTPAATTPAATTPAATTPAAKTPAAVIEIPINFQIPSSHDRAKTFFIPWIDEVFQRTGGRIKMVPYWASVLSAPADQWNAVRKGMCAMAEFMIDFLPGVFPVSDIVNLTHVKYDMGTFPSYSTRAWMSFYDKTPELQAEWKDVKVFWIYISPPSGGIGTKKKAIRTLADFKGVKLGCEGTWRPKVWKAWGAVPVGMVPGDMYMSIEKGVVDGSVCTFWWLDSRRFGEIIDYLEVDYSGGALQAFIMNWDVWNKLPADLREILDVMSKEAANSRLDESQTKVVFDAIKSNQVKWPKVETIWFSDEEWAKMNKLVEPVVDEMVEGLNKKGFPGRKLYDDWLKTYSSVAFAKK